MMYAYLKNITDILNSSNPVNHYALDGFFTNYFPLIYYQTSQYLIKVLFCAITWREELNFYKGSKQKSTGPRS
jgi:hypothetical protein